MTPSYSIRIDERLYHQIQSFRESHHYCSFTEAIIRLMDGEGEGWHITTLGKTARIRTGGKEGQKVIWRLK